MQCDEYSQKTEEREQNKQGDYIAIELQNMNVGWLEPPRMPQCDKQEPDPPRYAENACLHGEINDSRIGQRH
jgi:hypothetical protein